RRRERRPANHHRQHRSRGDPAGHHRGGRHRVAAVPDDSRLRDSHRWSESGRRSLRGHEAALGDDLDDVSRGWPRGIGRSGCHPRCEPPDDALVRNDGRIRFDRRRASRPDEPAGDRRGGPLVRRIAIRCDAHADPGRHSQGADRRAPGHDPPVPRRESRAAATLPPARRQVGPGHDPNPHQDVQRRGGRSIVDALIQALYSIPVVGLVFQLGGYIIAVGPSVAPGILQAATPVALAALCGVMCERAGVVNIGIEGIMLTSAFVGWYAGVLLAPVLATADLGPFGANPALVVALAIGTGSGVPISWLHAWLSISVRADQIISGTIINIVAFGLTGYLNNLIAKTSPNGAGAFTQFRPPREVTDIPVIGWILNMFLNQGPIAMSVIVLVIIFQILLFRSRWGLLSRAVGEHPRSAETV